MIQMLNSSRYIDQSQCGSLLNFVEQMLAIFKNPQQIVNEHGPWSLTLLCRDVNLSIYVFC